MRFIAGVLFVVGCGGPAAAPIAPTTSIGGPGSDVAALAPRESSMTPEQRTAMQPLLLNYGSGWALEYLERHYTIAVDETPDEYVMTLTARGASGVTGMHRLGKQGAFSGKNPTVPEGAALTPEQQATAEEIIRGTKTVWMVLREGRAEPVDVSQGFPALNAARKLETRLRDGHAVLYAREDGGSTLLAVVVDLAARQITEVTWHDIPPNAAGLVPAADVAAINEAMRLHGDFGVYGNVTPGIDVLAKYFSISLQKVVEPVPQRGTAAQTGGGTYQVGVYPRDGMGHELTFTVDLAARTISNMAAAHSVEQPAPRE